MARACAGSLGLGLALLLRHDIAAGEGFTVWVLELYTAIYNIEYSIVSEL